ncbi:MAG: fibronectin type III domain-containing protein, partial [Elusimicrobiota bacterium]
GAVSLSATDISGSGEFHADGGAAQGGAGDEYGGGGGGGRIAVSASGTCSLDASTASVSGGASAAGGAGDPSKPGQPGADGTVYTPNLVAPAGFFGVTASSVAVDWQWAAGTVGEYQVFSATNGAVSPILAASATNFIGTGLDPNTGYGAFLRSRGCLATADSSVAYSTTLARPLENLAVAEVFRTSITLNWTALPAAPQKDSSDGYRLEASTTADFSGTVVSSQTAYASVSTLSVEGLWPNTTYYLRAGAINVAGVVGYVAAGATATFANAPAPSAETFLDVFESSATLAWAALPASPPAASSESARGYRLEASTAADFSGAVVSSATPSVLVSTLSVQGLDPNTTHYFRVTALNHNAVGYPSVLGSTSTLAKRPDALPEAFLGVYETSVTVQWVSLPVSPPAASSDSAEGYLVYASSTDFGALAPGGLVFSSSTPNVALSTLTVEGLDVNTTFYFKVGSLNHNGVPNFTLLGSTATVFVEIGVLISTNVLNIGSVDVNSEIVISTSFIVETLGNVSQTYEIAATTITAGSPWSISASSGTDTFTLQAGFNATLPTSAQFGEEDKLLDSAGRCDAATFAIGQTCASLSPAAQRLLWLKLGMPRITSTEDTQEIRITITTTPP